MFKITTVSGTISHRTEEGRRLAMAFFDKEGVEYWLDEEPEWEKDWMYNTPNMFLDKEHMREIQAFAAMAAEDEVRRRAVLSNEVTVEIAF